uniref:AMP-dependent synthetase/ligase domain-containing protein n=1 Tax=Vitis vinifera TaxID=29760 RepID=A5BS99_VITVI|nr:hypothetical protein VITISV_043923 [Vitis vinifera]
MELDKSLNQSPQSGLEKIGYTSSNGPPENCCKIKNLWDIVPAEPGDRFLSMLPSWHAYERASEYFIFTHGIEQVYTTVPNLKEDLRRYQPQYLISVPLVYETLYRHDLTMLGMGYMPDMPNDYICTQQVYRTKGEKYKFLVRSELP